jgi:hypothetical protein
MAIIPQNLNSPGLSTIPCKAHWAKHFKWMTQHHNLGSDTVGNPQRMTRRKTLLTSLWQILMVTCPRWLWFVRKYLDEHKTWREQLQIDTVKLTITFTHPLVQWSFRTTKQTKSHKNHAIKIQKWKIIKMCGCKYQVLVLWTGTGYLWKLLFSYELLRKLKNVLKTSPNLV